MKKGMVAGSFDPVTNGHVWLIRQACTLLDKVVVAIAVNPAKKSLFSDEERLKLMHAVLRAELSFDDYSKVSVLFIKNDLLIKQALAHGASYIVRGLRSVQDFHYEQDMYHINREISPEVQTIYLMSPESNSRISSSTVKGLVGLNDWETYVSKYVSKDVVLALRQKLDMANG